METNYAYAIRAHVALDGNFSGAIGYLVLLAGSDTIVPWKVGPFMELVEAQPDLDIVFVSYARLLDELAARLGVPA